MLQRKNQVLLSFLKIRAVINGKEIYTLPDSKPVVITVQANNPRIVITDGYHITKPLKLVYKDLHTYCFKVVCAINDTQLIIGFAVLVTLYLSGFYTGVLALKVFSFFPVIYLLMFYYMNRKEFIRLVPVTN
ncbi:MAG: hypothetical protein JNK27_15635 [Chitinophagaceae bacterium]|nr:hypothetical protein [Chitinophagaceae bacterium]